METITKLDRSHHNMASKCRLVFTLKSGHKITLESVSIEFAMDTIEYWIENPNEKLIVLFEKMVFSQELSDVSNISAML